ncbi:hypothetical protein MRX96_031062 [Rhipicephalus microplus]
MAPLRSILSPVHWQPCWGPETQVRFLRGTLDDGKGTATPAAGRAGFHVVFSDPDKLSSLCKKVNDTDQAMEGGPSGAYATTCGHKAALGNVLNDRLILRNYRAARAAAPCTRRNGPPARGPCARRLCDTVFSEAGGVDLFLLGKWSLAARAQRFLHPTNDGASFRALSAAVILVQKET